MPKNNNNQQQGGKTMKDNTTNSIATLNFSLVSDTTIELFNKGFMLITAMSSDERALKNEREANKNNYLDDKDGLNAHLKPYREMLNSSRKKADVFATSIISRFIDFNDLMQGDIYRFDLKTFLVNIGAIQGDPETLKKSALEKLENIRSLVVDRQTATITRRKKGTNYLTTKYGKTLNNTSIELLLSIRDMFINSRCYDYDILSGTISRHDFSEDTNK